MCNSGIITIPISFSSDTLLYDTAIEISSVIFIQILRMSGNYVRKLGQEVFKNAGLLNLQRIFMNNCHVQVSKIVGPSTEFPKMVCTRLREICSCS